MRAAQQFILVLIPGAVLAGPAVGQSPPVTGQPTPTPAPSPAPAPRIPKTLASVAAADQPAVRQRAMFCYRMPDGTIWDGSNLAEYRKVFDRSVKPFDKIERGQGEPGQPLVEDRVIGTVWKIKPSHDADAWGLTRELGAAGTEIPEGRIESANRLAWTECPPLWQSAAAADFTWEFAYIDETDPDDYTRLKHGGYLELMKDLGEGRYEVDGYSLDRGRIQGVVFVGDPAKYIRKDRFKGKFFLWPVGSVDVPGGTRPGWKLIPAEELRISPDTLADALLTGRAQVVQWSYQRIKDKILWKRVVREIDSAPLVVKEDKPPPKPAPPVPVGGPDLVVLKDGRWFRGRVVRKDDQELVIRSMVGQMETDLTFRMDEVQDVQTPERR